MISPPRFKFSPLKLDTPSPVQSKRQKTILSSPVSEPFDFESNIEYSSAQIQTPVRSYYEIIEMLKAKSPESYDKIMTSLREDYKKDMAAKKRKTVRKIVFVPKSPIKSPSKSTISVKSKSPKKSKSPPPIKPKSVKQESEDVESTQIV